MLVPPSQGLGNIGSAGFANLFRLDFRDLVARNDAGPDLVFFDARFSADAYEVAVRPWGGDWSPFQVFSADEFVDTGVAGPVQPPGDESFRHSVLFGLPIELSDFGVGPTRLVDAIRFRAVAPAGSTPQGDPVMAAALNATAVAEPASLLTWLLLGLAAVRGRQRIRPKRRRP